MRKETLFIKIISHLRVDKEKLINLGFTKLDRFPRRIRDCSEDDMQSFRCEITSDEIGHKMQALQDYFTSQGFELSDHIIYGKKAVGFIRMMEREYDQPIWK
jgi:hypothetical protein